MVRVRACHGEAAEGGCGKRSRAAGSRSGDREPGLVGFVEWQRGRERGLRGGDRHAVRMLVPTADS